MSRLLQVIIALVGLTLSGVLGWASWKNDQLQTQQAYLMLFSQSIATARATCDEGLLQVAADAAQKLDELGGEGKYADHVSGVQGSVQGCATGTSVAAAPVIVGGGGSIGVPPPPPAAGEAPATATPAPPPPAVAVVEQRAAESQNLEFRRVQNTGAAQERGNGQFYAVLASYGVNDRNTFDPRLGASAHFNHLAAQAAAAQIQTRVFRTRVSQHYAIVLVPNGLTREAARDLVSTARRLGWSPDAFVQEARDWTPCAEPGTIEGLRACGA